MCINYFRMHTDSERCALICEDDVDLSPLHLYVNEFRTYVRGRPSDAGILQLVCCVHRTVARHPYDQIHPHVPWNDRHFSTCLYMVTPRGINDIYTKMFVGNVPRIPVTLPCNSDRILYNCTRSYTTNFPFARLQAAESTIHNDHIDFHSECIEKIEQVWKEHTLYQNQLHEASAPFKTQPFQKSDSSRYLLFVAAGDNSLYIHADDDDDSAHRSHTWDTVISYYGSSDENFSRLRSCTPHVYRSSGTKFDQFCLFNHVHSREVEKYAYVALLDDDILLCRANDVVHHRLQHDDYKSLCASNNAQCLQALFEACQRTDALVAQPACATNSASGRHVMSWWKNTHAVTDAPRPAYHFTNFIETNTICFRTDCATRLMKLYRYHQIPSWGSDIFFMHMLRAPPSRCLVFDDIVYFNPSMQYKKIAVREIDTLRPEDVERSEWSKFASKKNIPVHIKPKIYPSISKSRAFYDNGLHFLTGWDIATTAPRESVGINQILAIQSALMHRTHSLILIITHNVVHIKKVCLQNIFEYEWTRNARSILII